MERRLGPAPHHLVPILQIQEAALRDEAWRPQHDPHNDEPHPLQDDASRPHEAHEEAPRPRNADEGSSKRYHDDHLQQHVVLPLHAHVVGGVEAEYEQLLGEGGGGEEQRDLLALPDRGAEAVEGDGEGGVDEEGERDGSVLKVVEVVGGDSAVIVEGIVLRRADDELHGDRHEAAGDDKVELEVAELGGGEPWGRDVGAGAEGVETDVVVEVPQPDHQEAKTWRHMTNQTAHGVKAFDGMTQLSLE